MFKLYELTEMYQNLWEVIEDENVDLNALEIALSTLEDNIETKAESIAKFVKSMDGNIATLREEEKRLANKRKALENKQISMKGYLENQLTQIGRDKVVTTLFTIAMQNNPPSVKFTNEDLIPEKYKERIETIKIPKKAILDDLKAGIEVAGTEYVQTRSLRIR